VAVDNPSGFNASILGEIKRINDRLDQLSAAPLGKVKFATGRGTPNSLVVTTTPSSVPLSITVPALATSVGFSVFAMGSVYNTTSVLDTFHVRVDVDYAGQNAHDFFDTDVGSGREGTTVVPCLDYFTFAPGGGTLTLTASINAGVGPFTVAASNTIFQKGLFLFQY
jgi:hypothetical protein